MMKGIIAIVLIGWLAALSVLTYQINKKLNNLDQIAGQRVAVIENFLNLATKNENGSLYQQYLQEITKQK